MRLDHMRLAGLGAGRLDNIGVNRPLRQKLRAFQRVGLFLENLNKQAADDLSFLFRILDPGQRTQKTLTRVDADHAHAHVTGEGSHDLITFFISQQTGVHEYTGQLFTYGLVQQCRHHAGIYAA